MEVTVTVGRGPGYKRERYRYEETYFSPRPYPEAIFVDDQGIPGPFCEHCGRPDFMHGADKRRRPDTCPPPRPISAASAWADKRPDAVRVT